MKLTAQERKELIKLEKQIPHKGVSTRIKIILALNDGYPVKDVARILLLDEDTVTKWKKLYGKSRYLSDWLGTENNGYQGKLTKKQEKMIEQFVEKAVITDCQQVVLYIQQTFGTSYTIDGVTKLLHRLGFVYKQIIGIPGKLSEEKQSAFIREYQILKDNKKDDEVILFGDGVHPTHNLHKTKAWIKRGEEKQVKTNTGRGRLNINGAFNLETLTVTTHFSETINAQTTMELFDKIQLVYKDKTTIYLIIDNATYYKNRDVQAYLAKSDCRIKLVFLPSYSPNLNFIERLWKYMKKYIIGVKYREKFKQFEDDIHYFFDNIDQHEEKLRKFIGTELHLVKVTI
ncbi:MAG: IS630 family transposase [Nanoarchaeota archaeon]